MIDKWNLTQLAYLIGKLKGIIKDDFLDRDKLEEIAERLEKELNKVYDKN